MRCIYHNVGHQHITNKEAQNKIQSGVENKHKGNIKTNDIFKAKKVLTPFKPKYQIIKNDKPVTMLFLGLLSIYFNNQATKAHQSLCLSTPGNPKEIN